jgi:hypothetical protein
MTKKFKLLLLDAVVVIELFSLGLWDRIVDLCEIHLARTIVDVEAQFYLDEDGEKHYFDLPAYEKTNKIHVFDVGISDLKAFRGCFDSVYLEKLDPGETESLAYLLNMQEDCLICSADKIVFRVLGSLGRGEEGISLEEILRNAGLAGQLRFHFSKAYREKWTNKGFQEGLHGIGRKN